MDTVLSGEACALELGNSDVRQVVAPQVTSTRTDPKPPAVPSLTSAISSLTASGTVRKNQLPPGHRQTGALTSHVPMVREASPAV